MQIDIQRIDASLPLPSYQTDGSVGFDLITRQDTTIDAGAIGLIPSNVVVRVPKDMMLIIVPRSSMARKKGLICPHSIGIIDQDYCGPEDELMVQVQNTTKETVTVERGERIAQGIFVRIEHADWRETNGHTAVSRGGFGSTGHA